MQELFHTEQLRMLAAGCLGDYCPLGKVHFVVSLVIAILPTEPEGTSILINLLHYALDDLGPLGSADGIHSDFG